jgi:hypothetical protein
VPDFDPGPPPALEAHFAAAPAPPVAKQFWVDWGPVFYRGRLDGSARVLCVASDPGPTERIAGRTLVGNAGQRVQGFLAKLGLTRSYVCLNAWPYALHPAWSMPAKQTLDEPAQATWRNALYDAATGPALQAIVAFGGMAQEAIRQWTGNPGVHLEPLPHPSNPDTAGLLTAYKAAIPRLRAVVDPDPDGDASGPNYGTTFEERDYAAIPRIDLPFGAPAFLGDDAWVRAKPGNAQNSVGRPSPDDNHTLIWKAPPGAA